MIRYSTVCLALACLAPFTASAAQQARLREIHRVSAMDHDLSIVARIAASPNGAIWISQPQDGNIVGLRPGSRELIRIGSKGEGPGSFLIVQQILARDDSIWIFDSDLRRGTWFRASGRVLSTARIKTPTDVTNPRLVGAGPVDVAWYRGYAPDEGYGIHVSNHEGSGTREVSRHPSTGCSRSVRTSTGGISLGIPHCHRAWDAISPDGQVRAVAAPDRRLGDSAGVHVVVTSSRGEVVLDRTVWMRPSIIPATVRDSALKRLRSYNPGSNLGNLAKEILDGNLVPREYSPLVSIVVSTRGEPAITVRRGPRAERRLHLIASDSSPIIDLPLARNQEVRWVEGRRLLIVESDEDGLQDVVLYEVED